MANIQAEALVEEDCSPATRRSYNQDVQDDDDELLDGDQNKSPR
jgi:hypothetical protein